MGPLQPPGLAPCLPPPDVNLAPGQALVLSRRSASYWGPLSCNDPSAPRGISPLGALGRASSLGGLARLLCCVLTDTHAVTCPPTGFAAHGCRLCSRVRFAIKPVISVGVRV